MGAAQELPVQIVLRVVASIGATVVTTVGLGLAPADATTHRFWSYWTGGPQWTYSSNGPGSRIPPTDSVEGWHFVVSPDGGSASTPPGTASDYATLCPAQPTSPTGKKRVAVVIDFGPAGIAPTGDTPPATIVECVTAAENANGLQVLRKVARLRFDAGGSLCGVAGYPRLECPGDQATPTDRMTPSLPPTSDPTPLPPRPTRPADSAPAEEAEPDPDPSHASDDPASPTPTATTSGPGQAVPVEIPASPDAPAATGSSVPPWVAAMGTAMIAVLLALAYLVGRGRP